ncbi:MAG: ABC transporter permease [Armatimonadetes bacterium]|nr:ABC transporter permease [Armatimonadota bacterium]MDE2206437.1 ABC transporter permease [Armatimonadota bacterium]
MRENLSELWRFRGLLRQLIARDLKVRYKNSIFGFLWSIVPPLLQVVVYSFLVRILLHIHAPNYSAYLLCGLIPWTFFSVAVLDASQSLLIFFPVIKKVYLPREIIPLAIVVSNFVHFMLGWAVFFGAFYVFAPLLGIHIPVQTGLLWFPVITLIQFILVLGVGLWVAALNVFYEDVKFILQTLFGLLLFVFPVMFVTESVYYSRLNAAHPWMFKLYMLNPIASIIDAYRKTLLQPVPRGSFNMKPSNMPLPLNWPEFWGSALISVLILVASYAYFNSRKWKFVERP